MRYLRREGKSPHFGTMQKRRFGRIVAWSLGLPKLILFLLRLILDFFGAMDAYPKIMDLLRTVDDNTMWAWILTLAGLGFLVASNWAEIREWGWIQRLLGEKPNPNKMLPFPMPISKRVSAAATPEPYDMLFDDAIRCVNDETSFGKRLTYREVEKEVIRLAIGGRFRIEGYKHEVAPSLLRLFRKDLDKADTHRSTIPSDHLSNGQMQRYGPRNEHVFAVWEPSPTDHSKLITTTVYYDPIVPRPVIKKIFDDNQD